MTWRSAITQEIVSGWSNTSPSWHITQDQDHRHQSETQKNTAMNRYQYKILTGIAMSKINEKHNEDGDYEKRTELFVGTTKSVGLKIIKTARICCQNIINYNKVKFIILQIMLISKETCKTASIYKNGD